MEERKMKKILALLLAAIMLVAMCCSCGGSEDGDVPTLKIYMPAGSQTDLDLVVAEANKIVEKKIGAKMEISMPSSFAVCWPWPLRVIL